MRFNCVPSKRSAAKRSVPLKDPPDIQSPLGYAAPVPAKPRYAVWDPRDPRKGKLLADPELGHIILGEGATITQALDAASAPAGSFVWDRKEARVAYLVPGPTEPQASRTK